MAEFIREGYKFGILSIPLRNAAYDGPTFLDLGGSVYATSIFPLDDTGTLERRMGEITVRRMREAGLHLVIALPSQTPGILDAENKLIEDRLYQLYLCLLVSVPYIAHDGINFVTGANDRGSIDIRSGRQFDQTFFAIGAPNAVVRPAALRQAMALGAAFAEITTNRLVPRAVRAIGIFRNACGEYFLDQRCHQFVRAAEAFLDPPYERAAGQFARRAVLVTHEGMSVRETYYQMYLIRSATEHVRGGLSRIDGGSEKERRLVLARRTIEAEALARFCLWEFLGNRDLWPHWKDDGAVKAFWERNDSLIRKDWPSRLLLAACTDGFDRRVAEHGLRYGAE